MNNFLFLDFNQVTNAEQNRDCYDYAKDFFVPAIAIFFSIIAVYLGINRQTQLKKEEENETCQKKKSMLSEVIKGNTPDQIEKINKYIDGLEELEPQLSLDKFSAFTILAINSTNFKVIQDFGYTQLLELIDLNIENERKLFSNYWVAIDSVVNNMDNLNTIFKEKSKILQELSSIQNDLSKNIAIESREIIRDTSKNGDLLDLAGKIKKSIEIFNSSNDTVNFKLKTQMQSLQNLNKNQTYSHLLKSEYVQMIERTLSIISNVEGILQGVSETIANYKISFKQHRDYIKEFNNLLKTKIYITTPPKRTWVQKFVDWIIKKH